MANTCAAALALDVDMVVDGVDDAVNMAYSAWPERLYVLKPDGAIHYRGALGPSGFKPREAAAALAALLGETPQAFESAEPAAECVDDGFSGLWRGRGTGRIMEGEIPIRLTLALGTDGTVGGKAEVTSARYPLPFLDVVYDTDSAGLSGRVSMRGRPVKLTGTVKEEVLTAKLVAPNDMELMAFEARRVRKGPALVPGPEDPTGTWSGTATARDPALQGRSVKIVLTDVSAAQVAGTVTLGAVTATIEKGRYDPKTGAFAARATTADGEMLSLEATLTEAGATGSVMMQPALVVAFAVKRELTPADDAEGDE